MKKLLFISLLIPSLLFSQSDTAKGIKWTTGLSWEQVKAKAKTENKYIFLDLYTTWCGPCKMMDAQIFPDVEVGNYYNDKFISVKVQMDKTIKDNEQVKRWYDDAEVIGKQYNVGAYPSFVFLSSEGNIVHKEVGFKRANELITSAKTAITPGNPFEKYNSLVIEYNQGRKQYDQLPFMIKTASKLGEKEFEKQLIKDLTGYVLTLKKEDRYTKERIEMWAEYTFASTTRVFQFFYKDGHLIDKVMNQNGFAAKQVDNTIQSGIVTPFFKEQNRNKSISLSGMYMMGPDLKTDSSEADWKRLKKMIRKKFNNYYAKRNVLLAQIEWYSRHRNHQPHLKAGLNYLDNYCSIESENTSWINNLSYNAFLHTNDKAILNGYINWMEKVLRKKSYANAIDTYANLLYKIGRVKEAIEWEQKVIIERPSAIKTVEKMKRGEPTWQ